MPTGGHQPPSQHVQIRQAHQYVDLGSILLQTTVAGLGEPKLALDHPQHVLYPCPNRGVLAVALALTRRQIPSSLAFVLHAPTQTQRAATALVFVTGVAGIGKDDYGEASSPESLERATLSMDSLHAERHFSGTGSKDDPIKFVDGIPYYEAFYRYCSQFSLDANKRRIEKSGDAFLDAIEVGDRFVYFLPPPILGD